MVLPNVAKWCLTENMHSQVACAQPKILLAHVLYFPNITLHYVPRWQLHEASPMASAHLVMGEASVEEGLEVARVEPQRRAVLFDGAAELSRLSQCVAARVVLVRSAQPASILHQHRSHPQPRLLQCSI